MSDALIQFQENDPLKASTTNDNNNFLLNKITQAVQTVEGEMEALETRVSAFDVPVGAVMLWSAPSNIPTNWIAMVGQDISNEAYADLRTVIGRTSLPDTRGRTAWGDSTPLNYISAGLPDHGHTQLVNGSGLLVSYISEGGPVWAGSGYNWTGLASASNGIYGASNTVQPPSVTFVFIIKYQ